MDSSSEVMDDRLGGHFEALPPEIFVPIANSLIPSDGADINKTINYFMQTHKKAYFIFAGDVDFWRKIAMSFFNIDLGKADYCERKFSVLMGFRDHDFPVEGLSRLNICALWRRLLSSASRPFAEGMVPRSIAGHIEDWAIEEGWSSYFTIIDGNQWTLVGHTNNRSYPLVCIRPGYYFPISRADADRIEKETTPLEWEEVNEFSDLGMTPDGKRVTVTKRRPIQEIYLRVIKGNLFHNIPFDFTYLRGRGHINWTHDVKVVSNSFTNTVVALGKPVVLPWLRDYTDARPSGKCPIIRRRISDRLGSEEKYDLDVYGAPNNFHSIERFIFSTDIAGFEKPSYEFVIVFVSKGYAKKPKEADESGATTTIATEKQKEKERIKTIIIEGSREEKKEGEEDEDSEEDEEDEEGEEEEGEENENETEMEVEEGGRGEGGNGGEDTRDRVETYIIAVHFIDSVGHHMQHLKIITKDVTPFRTLPDPVACTYVTLNHEGGSALKLNVGIYAMAREPTIRMEYSLQFDHHFTSPRVETLKFRRVDDGEYSASIERGNSTITGQYPSVTDDVLNCEIYTHGDVIPRPDLGIGRKNYYSLMNACLNPVSKRFTNLEAERRQKEMGVSWPGTTRVGARRGPPIYAFIGAPQFFTETPPANNAPEAAFVLMARGGYSHRLHGQDVIPCGYAAFTEVPGTARWTTVSSVRLTFTGLGLLEPEVQLIDLSKITFKDGSTLGHHVFGYEAGQKEFLLVNSDTGEKIIVEESTGITFRESYFTGSKIIIRGVAIICRYNSGKELLPDNLPSEMMILDNDNFEESLKVELFKNVVVALEFNRFARVGEVFPQQKQERLFAQ